MLMYPSYNFKERLSLQFTNSHILNHLIIVASFVNKGSKKRESLAAMWGFFVFTCLGQFHIPPKQNKLMNFGEL